MNELQQTSVELPNSLLSKPFSEDALDRVFNRIKSRHIPPELLRPQAKKELCAAIDWAVTWYLTELGTSPAARRQRFETIKWGHRFQKACADMWGHGHRLPGDERLPAIFEWLDIISANFPKRSFPKAPWRKPLNGWRQKTRSGRSLSPAELLAGWQLPKIFAKHFNSRPKFSRGTDSAHGPCIDFIDGIFAELKIPFARDSIAAAIAAVRKSDLSTS